jgi:GH25 family lysozyme M1 (1,4-beta-N-acetylmuramidase)
MSNVLKNGIDVSYCQGNINFGLINKNQVGFAIIRSSFGWEEGQKDTTFERNYTGFKSLGIPVGAYHYSYAKSIKDAEAEADYFLKCVGNKIFDLPVYLDLEESFMTSFGKEILTDIALAFCRKIKKAGFKAGVYTGYYWVKNYINIEKLTKEGFSFWLAEWNSNPNPDVDCDIWQYGHGSKINGIIGLVDLNRMYVDVSLNNKKSTTTSTKTNTIKKTTVVTVNDRDTFIQTARSYIGCDGNYVCNTKLKLGVIYDWCAFTISSIMKDCNFIGKYIKEIEGGAGSIPRYSDGIYGTWFKKGTQTPQSGDLVTFRYNDYPNQDKYFSDHIGIVESVNGDTITTIEGNVDGLSYNWAGTSTCKRKTRSLDANSDVYAFYRPNWKSSTKEIITTSTSSSPSSNSIPKVEYQSYTDGKWLSKVINCNDTNEDGYAGIENKTIKGLKCKLSKGNIKYRVSLVDTTTYLPWVTNCNDTNEDGYAGDIPKGKDIDKIQIKLVDLPDYNVMYRVSLVGSTTYLPWVTNCNDTNEDGYAGIEGKSIDKIQIKIVKK